MQPSLLEQQLRLVRALTEINSRHLVGEGRRAGAVIELQAMLNKVDPPADGERVAQLEARVAAENRKVASLEKARRRLQQRLLHICDEMARERAS